MKVIEYKISLSPEEVIALSRILGRISDTEYKDKGICEEDIKLLHLMWGELVIFENLYEDD